MGRPTTLTKEMLINYGITNITEDGRVFSNDLERSTCIITKKTRYGTKSYRMFTVYDRDIYRKQKERGTIAVGMRPVILSRAIWAWYHDICPAFMDVDHINNNSLDDRLANYQLLTRKENLEKRKGYRNQYLSSFRG